MAKNRQLKAVKRLAGLIKQNPKGSSQLSDYSLDQLKYSGASNQAAANRAAIELSLREHGYRTPRK